jgi:hypothetical protein
VLFTLYLKEDINEDGSLKPAALQATARASGGKGEKGKPMKVDGADVPAAKESGKEKTGDTNDDDVD